MTVDAKRRAERFTAEARRPSPRARLTYFAFGPILGLGMVLAANIFALSTATMLLSAATIGGLYVLIATPILFLRPR